MRPGQSGNDLNDNPEPYECVPPCVTPCPDSPLNPGQATVLRGPDYGDTITTYARMFGHDHDDPTPEY